MTVKTWNGMLEVIEQQLTGEVDIAALARMMLTSEYHLRRSFSMLAGMPLSVYIRRRRMTVAAAAVIDGNQTLQHIAVRFGYVSADAFSRAFRAVHGVGPEQARVPGARLRSQPRLSIRITLEGDTSMDYRIVHKNAFRVAGYTHRAPLIYQGVNPVAAQFEESLSDDDYARLEALSDQEPAGVLSVCSGFDDSRAEGSLFDYWVAVATSMQPPTGLAVLEVPARTWAVFSTCGAFPEALQQLWLRVGHEWLPANPYCLVPEPELVRAEFSEDGTHIDADLWLAVEPD